VLAVVATLFIKVGIAHANPTYTLSGTLTDSSSSPIPGILVKIKAADGTTESAVTDSSGDYSISAPSDTYYMTLNIYNGSSYATVGSFQEMVLAQDSSSPSIDLTSGNVTQNLQLKTATLHVYAEDSSGNPVSGSAVSATDVVGEGSTTLYSGDPGESTSIADSTGTTNSSGEVDMTSLVGTEYGASTGGGSSTLCANIYGDNVCVPSDTTVTGDANITLQLPSTNHTISGTLTDGSGDPISGVIINMAASDGNTGSVTTASDGSYSMSLPPDTYYMKINSNYATIGNLQTAELDQDSSSPSIDLTSGNVTQNLQLHTATIHVTVDDASGSPVSGTAVTGDDGIGAGSASLYSGDPGETPTTVVDYNGTTDSSGEVDMTTLVGTEYGVTGSGGSSNICATISGHTYCLTSPVTITGDTNVTIVPTYTFSGTFTDSNGNPLAGATIQLDNNADGYNYSVTTASDGSFSLTVDPAEYYLVVEDSDADGMSLQLYQHNSDPTINLTISNITQNLVLPVATVDVMAAIDGSPATYDPIVAGTSASATYFGGYTALSLYSGDPGYYSLNTYQTVETDGDGDASFTSVVGATYSGEDSDNGICIGSSSAYCNSPAYTVTSGTNSVDVP